MRAQIDTPLDQEHLNEQIIQYVFLKRPSGGITDIALESDNTQTSKVRQGLCYGYCVIYSLMTSNNELGWWRSALAYVSQWKGDADSLAQLTDLSINPEGPPLTLEQLFEYVASNLLLYSGLEMVPEVTQSNLLTPTGVFQQNNESIKKRYEAQGVLIASEWDIFLKELSQLSTDSYVIEISHNWHSTTIRYDRDLNQWYYYDPNDSHGEVAFEGGSFLEEKLPFFLRITVGYFEMSNDETHMLALESYGDTLFSLSRTVQTHDPACFEEPNYYAYICHYGRNKINSFMREVKNKLENGSNISEEEAAFFLRICIEDSRFHKKYYSYGVRVALQKYTAFCDVMTACLKAYATNIKHEGMIEERERLACTFIDALVNFYSEDLIDSVVNTELSLSLIDAMRISFHAVRGNDQYRWQARIFEGVMTTLLRQSNEQHLQEIIKKLPDCINASFTSFIFESSEVLNRLFEYQLNAQLPDQYFFGVIFFRKKEGQYALGALDDRTLIQLFERAKTDSDLKEKLMNMFDPHFLLSFLKERMHALSDLESELPCFLSVCSISPLFLTLYELLGKNYFDCMADDTDLMERARNDDYYDSLLDFMYSVIDISEIMPDQYDNPIVGDKLNLLCDNVEKVLSRSVAPPSPGFFKAPAAPLKEVSEFIALVRKGKCNLAIAYAIENIGYHFPEDVVADLVSTILFIKGANDVSLPQLFSADFESELLDNTPSSRDISP